MIGNKIKGLRHLCRSVGDSNIKKVLLVGQNCLFCRVFVKETSNSKKYNVCLISDAIGNNTAPSWLTNEDIKRAEKEFGKDRVLFIDIRNTRDYMARCNYAILLPDNIISEIDSFLSCNKKLCESVVSRYCKPHDYVSVLFYILSNASPNYYSWALNNFFKHGVTSTLLINCLTWIDTYPQIVKKLSKSTPLAYNGFQQLTELYDEMFALRREKRMNDVMNMFNTAQKKILKNHSFNVKDMNTMSKFYVLSLEKQNNFIRKMSTIGDVNEIMHQMHLLTKTQFNWNKESVIDFIKNAEGLKCEIVFDKDNTLVVRVDNYEAVKYLAKTTNWCISKNKSYWNNYTHAQNVKQFILFDFSKKEDDKLSIVGFTVNNDKFISHAHNFVNDNIIQNEPMIIGNVRQFLPKNKGIIDVLKSNNVNSSVFIRKRDYPFNWDKESLLEYMHSFKDSDIDIICDEEQKLAVIWYGDDFIRAFNNAQENCDYPLGFAPPHKTFIFADFSESIVDGLMYCEIVGNSSGIGCESPRQVNKVYGFGQCNIPFNYMLRKFNLPLNVIRRVYGNVEEFNSAVYDCDIETISRLLSDDNFVQTLKKSSGETKEMLFSSIQHSVFTHNTADIFTEIYKHEIKLSEIIGSTNTAYIMNSLIEEIINRVCRSRGEEVTILDDYEQMFEENDLKAWQLVINGYLYVLNMISDVETDQNIGRNLNIEPLRMLDRFYKFRIRIINMVLKYVVNIKSKLNVIIDLVVFDNNIEAMKFIIQSNPSQSMLNKLLNSLPREHEIAQTLVMSR